MKVKLSRLTNTTVLSKEKSSKKQSRSIGTSSTIKVWALVRKGPMKGKKEEIYM